MRKAYISIAALLLCGSMLMAQTPANVRPKRPLPMCWLRSCGETAAYNKLMVI